MKFVYAAELKKQFACYGHFYELELMDASQVSCRSVLEIVSSAVSQADLPSIAARPPDAVVIMMNPGSSHPKDTAYEPPVLSYPHAGHPLEKELVLTQPDNTQYQVMRVAVHQGWNHVRVLNLSDLRDPKSGHFLQRVAACREVMNGHTHSLFSLERLEECMQSLQRKRPTPILLGWGQDLGLLPLAEQCMLRIKEECIVTVPSAVHPLLNAHPSPMMQKAKLQWLDDIIAALNTV